MVKNENALKRRKGVKKSEILFNFSRAKVIFHEEVVESHKVPSRAMRRGWTFKGGRGMIKLTKGQRVWISGTVVRRYFYELQLL